MSKKLYVGNLPFSTTQEDLKNLFAPYGEITEALVITNKFSGRSKGFGFVTLADDAKAAKAIEELNDKEMEGRKIKVNEAAPFDPNAPRKPRRDFGDRNGGGRGFGGGGRRNDRRD